MIIARRPGLRGIANHAARNQDNIADLMGSAMWWVDFDGPYQGRTVQDKSVNNHNINIVLGEDGLWTDSPIGKGFSSSPSIESVWITKSWAVVNNFSFFTVMEASGYTGTARNVQDFGYYYEPYGFSLGLRNSSNAFSLAVKNTAGTATTCPTMAFPPDTIFSIGATWNGATLKWYYNGAPYTGSNASKSLSGPINVGYANITPIAGRYDGVLSEGVKIYHTSAWNAALDPTTLRHLHDFIVMEGGKRKFFLGSDSINRPGMSDPIAHLTIPTYEGSGQAVHPSVVYIPGGWGGYTFWMATTPYPGGNDEYENPSIFGSQDGINWEVPSGITNPIALPASGLHLSDPELVFDDTNLICYYLENGGTSGFKVIASDHFANWKVCLSTGPRNTFEPFIFSH